MTKAKRTIEIDEDTATGLERRAAERGLSVSQLVAELVFLANQPVAVAQDEIAELDRRWAEVSRWAADGRKRRRGALARNLGNAGVQALA
jgi:hypothetical protein